MRHARIPDPRPHRETPISQHIGETSLKPATAEKVVILLGENHRVGKKRPFYPFGKNRRPDLPKPTAGENELWNDLDE